MKRRDILIDLLAFAATVAIAAWQKWQASDIIWGLWISSLILGYSFIVTSALSIYTKEEFPGSAGGKSENARIPDAARKLQPAIMSLFFSFALFMFLGIRSGIAWLFFIVSLSFSAAAFFLRRLIGEGSGKETQYATILRRFLAYTPAVAFLLGFFTIHFGGFHFVHSMFLHGFFPIFSANPMQGSLGDIFSLFLATIGKTATEYWPFILFGAVSRLDSYKRAFASEKGPNMMMPYANVFRMHILIFVFAGLNAAELKSFAIYPVLVFYFLPVGPIIKAIAGAKSKNQSNAPDKQVPAATEGAVDEAQYRAVSEAEGRDRSDHHLIRR